MKESRGTAWKVRLHHQSLLSWYHITFFLYKLVVPAESVSFVETLTHSH